MLIPIGTQHLETADLRSRAYMLADTGTYIVVANTYQANRL